MKDQAPEEWAHKTGHQWLRSLASQRGVVKVVYVQPPFPNFDASKKGAGHKPRRGDDRVAFAMAYFTRNFRNPTPT